MPSETPRLPQETYTKMLRRGASGGLGLQAGDVAEYKKTRNKWKIAVMVAALTALAALALGAMR